MLSALLGDAGRRRELARAARERAAAYYDWALVIDAYADLLRGLMSRTRDPL
jgi:glycosyltransferase involved in cell wall biosynthesis